MSPAEDTVQRDIKRGSRLQVANNKQYTLFSDRNRSLLLLKKKSVHLHQLLTVDIQGETETGIKSTASISQSHLHRITCFQTCSVKLDLL